MTFNNATSCSCIYALCDFQITTYHCLTCLRQLVTELYSSPQQYFQNEGKTGKQICEAVQQIRHGKTLKLTFIKGCEKEKCETFQQVRINSLLYKSIVLQLIILVQLFIRFAGASYGRFVNVCSGTVGNRQEGLYGEIFK